MAHEDFQLGDLTAVIGDNEAYDDRRAGYSGIHRLVHRTLPEKSLFGVAGLNFEHIFDGAQDQMSLSGDRTKEAVPEPWRGRFGGSVTKRFAAAFFGGALMMFGARLAQGCTSGHGISGALQLAVSSWVFVVVFFADEETAVAAGYRPCAVCLPRRVR